MSLIAHYTIRANRDDFCPNVYEDLLAGRAYYNKDSMSFCIEKGDGIYNLPRSYNDTLFFHIQQEAPSAFEKLKQANVI